MNKQSNKKAFTLVELIVVMAIVGILVLLAVPKFMGHTKEAKFTKFIANTKNLETASERYYMDHQDWPRLSDIPYSADQITAFADKIYDSTGKTITLDPTGKYYDIDYDILNKYISVPDDKSNYIIQNPVGNVYALDGLKNGGETRVSNHKPKAVITMTPDTEIMTTTNIVWNYSSSTDPDGDSIVNAEWQDKQDIYTTPGTYTVQLRVQDSKNLWSDWVSKTFVVSSPFTSQTFNYTGNVQPWTVPATGKYKLEVWGAQGGNMMIDGWTGKGGKGGYTYGTTTLQAGTTIYVYVGGAGQGYDAKGDFNHYGGWNGGGTCYQGASGGGGATDIRTVSGAWNDANGLTKRIIVAGGGGGSNDYTNGGAGGGLTGGNGQLGRYPNDTIGTGATQTSGGTGWINGSFGIGGGAESSYGDGGAGGGGWYGGGKAQGFDVAGGGGSSYYGTLENPGTTAGIQSGNGKAIITYVGQ